jgi:hemerythrin-like domain-containing protein
MQARGPLMIEHRLIEKMLNIVNNVLIEIEKQETVDPVFVDTVVDFIRTYADRTHHGKEEDILFRELEKKDMSNDDHRLMNELIEEHIFGRKITRELIEANARYRRSEKSALPVIIAKLSTLVDFYPKHIEKEDKVFFPASRVYLSEEEEQAMIKEFWEFDRKMIHEKYETLVQELKAD